VRILSLSLTLLFAAPALAASPSAQVAQFLAAPSAQRGALAVNGGLALVTVDSDSATGTGILFLLDGKPRVLTASHVLQGARAAKISGTFSLLKAVNGEVVLDSPSDDLAVLSVADSLNAAFLIAVAKANFSVCTTGAVCSAVPPEKTDNEEIVSSSAGVPTFVKSQNRFQLATRSPDQYVSGRYPFVWMIDAYTRSGVSGGAYYRGGVFSGLVTKVSHGLQSLTIAIPSEGIAAALRVGAKAGGWLPGGKGLEVRTGSDVIVEAMREGGDLGNGGDDKHSTGGEPRAWHLLLTGCFYCMGDINRVIENPFVDGDVSAPLEVNGKPVVAFSKFGTLQVATLARYLYLRGKNAFFSMVAPGDPALAQLRARRAAKPFALPYFQVFKKEAGNVLENARPIEGNFHDGVTFFLLDYLRGPQPALISPYPQITASNTDSWLDLNYPDFRLHFRVAKDLSRIDLLSAGNEGAASLPAQPFTNPVKSLYGGNGVRALFLYDEADLTSVQALILETRDSVYQLNNCNPNVGCGSL